MYPEVIEVLFSAVIYLSLGVFILFTARKGIEEGARIIAALRSIASYFDEASDPVVVLLDKAIEAATKKPFNEGQIVALGVRINALAEMMEKHNNTPSDEQ
jgi:DNA repair ATPase RecN